MQMLYFVFFVSFVLCTALTPVIRFIAIKKDWMAKPVKERWHKKTTALLGGIAIYLSIAIPLFVMADFTSILPHIGNGFSLVPKIQASVSALSPLVPKFQLGNEGKTLPPVQSIIWIGMTLLFILGLLDDFIRIKPHTKLVGQILVASMVTFFGFRLHWFISLTLDTIITIVWVVGITNAFNLIDNMDGLCSGIGMIASLYLAVLFTGILPESALVAVMLAGGLAGFLIYNFNPAKIFMGDCGSLIIGFILSMLTLYYSEQIVGNALSSYAVPIMVLMVPILDTTMVTLIRLLSGRKASVGGKDHTSHRLVLMGFSEKGSVLFLYGVGVISGLSAVFVSKNDTLTSPAVIIPLAISVMLMGIYLAQLRVYPEKEFSLLRNRAYTPILMELTYKRQIILVMLDFCLIAFAYYLAYRLRFESEEFRFYFKIFLHSLPAVIACKFVVFFIMGVYRGIWRYMSTNDVFVHLKASFFATVLCVAMITYIYGFKDFSKEIFVIDWLLTTALLLGTRGSFRISVDMVKRKTLSGERIFIYGAGRGGEILLREILNNKKRNINPVGLIDDDVLKVGKKLLGYPILGTFSEVKQLSDKHNISGLVISFNGEASLRRIESVREFCKANDLSLKRFSVDLYE